MAKKQPAPSDLADKFMLRMPDGMRERIAMAAEANGRSMNSEIIHRLEATFRSGDDRLLHDGANELRVLTSMIRSIERRLDAAKIGKGTVFDLEDGE